MAGASIYRSICRTLPRCALCRSSYPNTLQTHHPLDHLVLRMPSMASTVALTNDAASASVLHMSSHKANESRLEARTLLSCIKGQDLRSQGYWCSLSWSMLKWISYLSRLALVSYEETPAAHSCLGRSRVWAQLPGCCPTMQLVGQVLGRQLLYTARGFDSSFQSSPGITVCPWTAKSQATCEFPGTKRRTPTPTTRSSTISFAQLALNSWGSSVQVTLHVVSRRGVEHP
jgi:hypothetical protein